MPADQTSAPKGHNLHHGLCVIGKFAGVEPVTRKDGTSVTGLFKLLVDTGRSWPLGLTFRDVDDLGEPSRVAEALDRLGDRLGDDEVVVPVTASTQEGSRYSNLDALTIWLLEDRLKPAPSSTPARSTTTAAA